MEKQEILKKSRLENKRKDLYQKEVEKESGYAGAIAAGILCVIFFSVQAFTGGGMNYGLYAIGFSLGATDRSVKAFKSKKLYDIIIAVVYCIVVLAFSAMHIYNLIAASAVR